VELIICDASVAERVRREGGIALISDPVLRAIGERVLDRRATDAYFEPLELLRELPVEMAERVRRRMDDAQGTTDEARLVADEWFARHAERDARGGRRALIARLRAAEHRGDHAEVDATLEALRRFAGPLERDEPR
jgi:hypothetical protein